MINPVKKTKAEEVRKTYPSFAKLNGDHPFKQQVPQGRVEYQARSKKGGKIAFFHFELARQMGLIPKNHPNELTPELEKEILETFSIVIINEYDIENNIKFPEDEIKPQTYMATRYLQLQHPDKTGRNSGDGRTVWNGTIRHNGVTWDVSSCGTGATRLSPACSIYKKFFQTGDPFISYGCGCAEADEGYETLFFSEVFHRNHVPTERILAVIEYDKGLAINVRAYPNLMRPSHFFGHLKQGNHKTLKQVTDYYISRQIENGAWEDVQKKSQTDRYNYMLDQICTTFAHTVANFEDDYIFCWLDWDGDNILMDGGIIDYGSIRQFGLFHSEYRYDDVQRFSTTILEQKQKARYIVQCFAQIVDFLLTKNKRPLAHFRHHNILKKFDERFQAKKNQNLLRKMGLRQTYVDYLLKNHMNSVRIFRRAFTYFEREKTAKGIYKVADGVNRDAIFCMRDFMRELPQLYLTRGEQLSPEEFQEVGMSSYAKKTDMRLTSMRLRQIQRFQTGFMSLVELVSNGMKVDRQQVLLDMTMRSSVINKFDRVTGDSITFVVNKISRCRPKLNSSELFNLITDFKAYQNMDPDQPTPAAVSERTVPARQKNIFRDLTTIVRDCREGL